MLIKLGFMGDTIVEVLIVLAILGMAISIAYATANRSLINTRQAEENSEATTLVQTQIENLRNNASITTTTDPNYVYDPAAFCFNGSSKQRAGGPSCTFTAYNIGVSIAYAPIASPGGTFKVTAIWDDVSGEGTDSVVMSYRLYP